MRQIAAVLMMVSLGIAAAPRFAAAGTVGYWRFETGSGSTAIDSSGQGNNGTLSGDAAWVSLVPYAEILEQSNTYSIQLDGSGDIVTIPDSNSLDVTTAFTVEAFVRLTAATSFSGLVVKRDIAGNSPSYGLIFASSSDVRAAAQINSSSKATAASTLSLNVWHHVAAVYDGAALSLYVDGDFNSSVPATGLVEVSANDVIIGRYSNDLPAQVDEVRISNVALSPLQFLRAPIFDDGFESTNTSAWSATVP